MTRVASTSFWARVNFVAARMAPAKSIFMSWVLWKRWDAASANAIGQRALDLLGGVERAQHGDRFDGL